MRCALSIAGSDSIGGAGIQADIRAMNSQDVHCCTVITAVTAQNTESVSAIYPMPEDMIISQLEAVLKDVDIKAVKTGMLYSPEIVNTVADILEDHEMPLVVDPVMVAGVGDSLAESGLAAAIKKRLIPICEVVTPNRYEAEVLADMSISDDRSACYACEVIGKDASTVLLKGGHMSGKEVTDYLYISSEIEKIVNPRLERAGHGGGCTLSSFITANLAKSMDTMNAILTARDTIQQSIATMYVIGSGDKLVNPSVRTTYDRRRFDILDRLDDASIALSDIVSYSDIPSGGLNLAFAAKNAAGPEDVAALDSKMTFHNGEMDLMGKSKFGVADALSFIVLTAMDKNPDYRSAVALAYSDDLLDVIEEVGFVIADVGGNKNKLHTNVSSVISSLDELPDVLYRAESKTDEGNIWILGKNPEDVIEKLKLIL